MLRLFPQKNEYIQEKSELQFNAGGPIPQHAAIIAGDNSRWAQNQRSSGVADHKGDMEAIREITKRASGLGVKILILYAFSTEN